MKVKKIMIYSLAVALLVAQSALSFQKASAAEYTQAEVTQHSSKSDCWVIVSDKIFDLSAVVTWHADVITCGTDSTSSYLAKHGNLNTISTYEIGTLANTPINRAPSLDFIPEIVALEGALVKINASASDPDNDSLTLSYASPFNSNGEWQTAQGDARGYTVRVSVSDGELSDFQNLTITILPLIDDTNSSNDNTPPPVVETNNDLSVTKTVLAQHSSTVDCWVAVFNQVYNISPLMDDYGYFFTCGVDNTIKWQNSMFGNDVTLLEPYRLGILIQDDTNNDTDEEVDMNEDEDKDEDEVEGDDSEDEDHDRLYEKNKKMNERIFERLKKSEERIRETQKKADERISKSNKRFEHSDENSDEDEDDD